MPTPRKSLADHKLAHTKPEWSDPDPFQSGKPKMPADLPPLAEGEWKRLVPQLGKRKTLTKADASAFEIYVRAYSRWRKVADLAELNPIELVTWVGSDGIEHSKTVESPASKMAARLEGQLARYLKEFSATPASRDRTKAAPPPSPPPDPDEHVLDRNAEQPVPDDTPEIDIYSEEMTKALEALS